MTCSHRFCRAKSKRRETYLCLWDSMGNTHGVANDSYQDRNWPIVFFCRTSIYLLLLRMRLIAIRGWNGASSHYSGPKNWRFKCRKLRCSQCSRWNTWLMKLCERKVSHGLLERMGLACGKLPWGQCSSAGPKVAFKPQVCLSEQLCRHGFARSRFEAAQLYVSPLCLSSTKGIQALRWGLRLVVSSWSQSVRLFEWLQ